MFLLLLFLLVLNINVSSGVNYSLETHYTVVTGIPSVPDFWAQTIIENVIIGYFDSKINQFESEQEWMKNLGENYVKDQTKNYQQFTEILKEILKIVKKKHNDTGGVHTLQQICSCSMDDETGIHFSPVGRSAYDGTDMILEMKNVGLVAAMEQAAVIKQKLDGAHDFCMYCHSLECDKWLQEYIYYGNSSLQRKVPPQVSLLQTDSSSPVVCHATGFYPDKVNISWQKDGQDLHEDVDVGETLPNHDGTFQKRAKLKVTADVWKKNQFTCVVEHKSGDPIHMILTEEKIRTNSAGTASSTS
uniref:Ig-like domain-containing protein n=1 Tax=Denticeps clupeoides TaxID=299321 RepID=A0AAY4CRK5_9TELE